MDAALRKLVRRRAGNRCEYCRLAQEDLPLATFHVEHVTPRKHRGGDDEANLALACDQCNLHKGPNLSGIDPETEDVVELFHPRRQNWAQHFSISEGRVIGLTPCGRATVVVCDMNSPDRVEVRRELAT
jgi:hypothetical protein